MITRKSVRIRLLLASRRVRVTLLLIAVYYIAVEIAHRSGVDFSLPMAVPAAVGTALSILLGFRTSAAYDRWWEARQIWGAIVNDSRTFARQVLTLLVPPPGAAPEHLQNVQQEMVLRQAGWCYSLAAALRKEDSLTPLRGFVSDAEIEALRAHANHPNALLQTQGELLAGLASEDYVDPIRHVALDATLTRLTDHMGKCERIKSTVFPYTYSYLVKILDYLFTALLPLAMVEFVGWLGGLVAFLIAGVFSMIELFGAHLQDPFERYPSDTPMTALSRTIEINLRQQLGQTDTPPKLEPVDGVLM